MNSTGAKFDGGKLLFSLLTRGLALPLKSVVAVLTYGAAKYDAESWKDVPDAKRRYEDALDRHLNAWKAGETHDDESGLHHLAHAACNILFIMHFEMNRNVRLGEQPDNWFKFNDSKDIAKKVMYPPESVSDKDESIFYPGSPVGSYVTCKSGEYP